MFYCLHQPKITFYNKLIQKSVLEAVTYVIATVFNEYSMILKSVLVFIFKNLVAAFTKAMAFFLLSQKMRTLSSFQLVIKEHPDLKFITGNVLQDLLLILKIIKRTYIAHKKRKVSSIKLLTVLRRLDEIWSFRSI